MKKIAVILSLFTLVFLVLFIILKGDGQKLHIVYVDEFEEKTAVKVCARRPDGKLVLVDVEKHTNEDDLLYILKTYDHYHNALPPTYVTPLSANFEVIKFEKTNIMLAIELKMTHLKSGLQDFFTALMWSYQYRGIEGIDLKINKESFQLAKNRLINPESAATTPYGNIAQTIFHREGDEILPVTYLHRDDRINFLMHKVIAKYPDATYEYETVDRMITIRITDPEEQISKDVIEMLLLSIDHLDIFDHIIIIKNGAVIAHN